MIENLKKVNIILNYRQHILNISNDYLIYNNVTKSEIRIKLLLKN